MKKYLLFVAIFCRANLTCEESSSIDDNKREVWLTSAELRAGYFYFIDENAREIYDNGTIDLEIENNIWWTHYNSFWVNFNFIWANGQSELFLTASNVNIATLSGGIKGFFPIKSSYIEALQPYYIDEVEVYLGVGFAAAIIWTNDQTAFLPNQTVRFSPGVAAKFGFLIHLGKNFFLDPFFDYYYQPTTTRQNNTVDIGGFRTGAGIGYLF
jgi:hypothetical protein